MNSAFSGRMRNPPKSSLLYRKKGGTSVFDRLTTDRLNWILIIGVILFIIEIAFFQGGMIFSALFCGCMIYVGKKYFDHLWGKIVFLIGVIGFIFIILYTLVVCFLLFISFFSRL